VDQFEELVAADPVAADELLDRVAALLRAAPPHPGGTPALRAVFTALAPPVPNTLALPRMGPAELRAVLVGPADLVSFEPGLVDRIIADAADVPGQLPVVELTLTRLWETAQGGTLTHRAYDEQGGMAGPLAVYAEEVCARHLSPEELAVAERLLVQLARPDEDGTFTLTPVRLDQLDAAARDMAGTFARHHLVVLRAGADEPATVVPAHEALVQRWPRLREWLVAAQEFRSWQEQLRSALRQWQRSGRDSGTLLRGTPLSTAEEWLASHPSRLTGEERDYITASRRHERRDVRRWRSVTALIGVLAVAATTLAVVAATRNRELTDQLRRAAAVSLGQEAQRRAETDPLTALQLAQSAWHQDGTTPEAYAALLQQYLRYAAVREIRPGFWSGPLHAVATTGDGRVTAVAEEDGTITVWTGLLGPAPERWFVATVPRPRGLLVSPDGRWLAVAGERGGITLWNIDERSGPLPLRPEDDSVVATYVARSARFSSDGQVLVLTLRKPGAAPLVEVWDVPLRQPVASDVVPDPAVTDVVVRRVEPGGGRAWFSHHRADGTRRTVLQDLATGAVVRETPASYVTPDGVFVSCGPRLTVLDPATGAARHSTAVFGCPEQDADGLTDLSGRYALTGSRSTEDSLQRLNLVDLRTGQAYLVDMPPDPRRHQVNDLIGHRTETVLAVPAGSGPPAVYVFANGTLLRTADPRPVDDATMAVLSRDVVATALSPGGRVLVALTTTGRGEEVSVTAVDVRTGRRIEGTADTTLDLGANPRVVFSDDGRYLLAAGDSAMMTTLLASDLTVVRTFYAGDYGYPSPNMNTSVVPLAGDKVAVLHNSQVSTWRISTGEQLGATIFREFGLMTGDGSEAGQRPTAIRWPVHPDQMLISTNTAVELWDLDPVALVREFPGRAGTAAPAILADPPRQRVAVHDRNSERLELWYPEQENPRYQLMPVPDDQSPVAFTPDGKVVTASDADNDSGSVHVWDPDVGARIAGFRVPGALTGWAAHDGTLVGATRYGPQAVDLRPRHWIEHLCGLHHRDYTAEERALLPTGADADAPCPPTR
jgi:WD40 repeat protein